MNMFFMNVFFSVCFLVGFLLPSGAFSAETRMLLFAFLGLLSVGFLSALMALIMAPFPLNLSVLGASDQSDLIRRHIRGLFTALLCVLVAAASIIILSIFLSVGPFQISVDTDFLLLDRLVFNAPERLLQAVIYVFFIGALDRTWIIARAFEMVLGLRQDAAVVRAREHIDQRAPSSEEIRDMFKAGPGHGKKITINLTSDD